MSECVFCRIASGEIPAGIVARTDQAVAFRDLNPQAPTHVLVIPTTHVSGPNEAEGERGAGPASACLSLAVQVARDLGLAEEGYRLVINSGKNGGQTVFHLHVHLLGGRRMSWPPG